MKHFPVYLMVVISLVWPMTGVVGSTTDDGGGDFTLEAFLEVPVLTSPRLSPDGQQVAYLHSQRSVAEDRRERQLWIAAVGEGEPQRITYDESAIYSIAWRPGGGLSYISDRGEAPQVWFNPLDGSEPRPVTDLSQGVSAFWWSPDGTRLAVLASIDEEDEDESAMEAEAEEPDQEGDWIVYDRLEHPDEYPQLWILSASAEGPGEEQPRRLTSPPLYAKHVAWSPDGATIALTYKALFSGLVDEDDRIALVDVASGEFETFTPDDRHSSLAAFSPDGSRLAFFTDRHAELRAYLNLKDVVVRELSSGDQEVLTVDSQLTLGGYGSTPDTAPVWSADGRDLYVLGAEGTSLDLYRVGTHGGSLVPVTRLKGNIGGVTLAAGMLAYTESELHRPGALWVRSLEEGSQARKVDDTDGSVAEFGLQAPRKLALPGHDGFTVEGFLFLPPSAPPDTAHPTVVEMHGGPYSRYGNAWTSRYPWQVLAHNGFAVFIANPRGGTAYGERFLRGVYRNFGTDDCLDLLAAVDALVEQGIADPERLGFTGYSYGGLMTNAIISRSDRFKAAVSIAGVFNYVSAVGQNNPQLFIDSYRQPWSGDLQRLWEHSPASRVHHIRTPTLIMHGVEDEPVDPRQSKELFTYLQLNATPSRLVLYPGEGHGINLPSHMLDYQTRELQWFRHYLLGDDEAAGAEEPVPVEPTIRLQ
jgi:dipeptidyl aminopeptidase/acylaminoacyl peptidase